MIVSLNWLKKYTNITIPVDELSTLIGARLVEIENTENIGMKYEDVIVVRIIECSPIEGTDHLNVTKIDDGGMVQNVERDENGFVQVVCGAPNVRTGMLAAWLPPGSTVPETAHDDTPFVLTPKNLRGVVSNGMLASAKELALFDDHSGILELQGEMSIGLSLATALELDDTLLNIENKSLTHRPDTFGIVGFAREVAAIQGLTFVTPDWLRHTDPEYNEKQGDVIAPSISIDTESLSARYQAVILSGADSTKQSPLWIQTYLSRVGLRPINAVVDVTNYLMMLTGQPLHAFDYDKVQAIAGSTNEIHVRSANEGEELELLDGRTVKLDTGDIVIAAGATAIGLAGAMGGANTIIDETTKNIILESATFNLYNLRSTQMRHGIFSEAITRFTKGQPAELTAPVLAEAIKLMHEWAGAVRVSEIAEAYPSKKDPVSITVTIDTINAVLGTELSVQDVTQTLVNANFIPESESNTTITVTAPYWRADIHIAEDIIEEVGRLRGYDQIDLSLPKRDFSAVSPSEFDTIRKHIRSALVRAGGNEVLTYSFVHGDILKKSGQSKSNSYRITNSISPDLQYYRQSITPSLLNLVYPNVKQGNDQFAIFELNKTHQKSRGLTDENVPVESNVLALSVTKRRSPTTSPFYQAKDIVEYLAKAIGLTFSYELISGDTEDATFSPFEYKRSARVVEQGTGIPIGIVGEYKKSVSREFKLPDYSAGFELDTMAIFEASKMRTANYTPLSKYPSTERDLCFQVSPLVTYADIVHSATLSATTLPVSVTISPLDIYQPDTKDSKNITIRLLFTSAQKTLIGDEVSEFIATISQKVISDTDATIV